MKLITYVNPASKLTCERYNIAYNLGVPPSSTMVGTWDVCHFWHMQGGAPKL